MTNPKDWPEILNDGRHIEDHHPASSMPVAVNVAWKLDDGFSAATETIKNLREELESVRKKLAEDPDSLGHLLDKVQSELTDVCGEIKGLNTALKDVKGKIAGDADSLGDRLSEVQTGVIQVGGKIDGLRDALGGVKEALVGDDKSLCSFLEASSKSSDKLGTKVFYLNVALVLVTIVATAATAVQALPIWESHGWWPFSQHATATPAATGGAGTQTATQTTTSSAGSLKSSPINTPNPNATAVPSALKGSGKPASHNTTGVVGAKSTPSKQMPVKTAPALNQKGTSNP